MPTGDRGSAPSTLDPARLSLLARMKGLRGTVADPFRHGADRRLSAG